MNVSTPLRVYSNEIQDIFKPDMDKAIAMGASCQLCQKEARHSLVEYVYPQGIVQVLYHGAQLPRDSV